MLSVICQNGLQSYYFFLTWQKVLRILCDFSTNQRLFC
jgi:hypothetical protein